MKDVIICVGISGSGKSTWTTNFIKENPNYLRINRDDIRKTLVGNLDGYYQRKDLNSIEQLVSELEFNIADAIGLDEKYNIIIDNTNLKLNYFRKWIMLPGFDFKFKLFDISLEEAKSRVYRRENNINVNIIPPPKEWINNEKVKYIDKQYQDYQNIKKFIETNYKDKII